MISALDERREVLLHAPLNGTGPEHDSSTLSDQTPAESMAATPSAIPSHPLGIKPLGNLYFSTTPNARLHAGGFQVLPDELLMPLLEYLDQDDLCALGSACRFLYAFCRSDELWKPLFIESYSQSHREVSWLGSWRRTLLGLGENESAVDCSNVFSDVLHRPFACTHIDLSDYAQIPEQNKIQSMENLSHDEFTSKWSSIPFILTKCIQEWPAYGKWTIAELRAKFSGIEFRAEAVDWPFAAYCDYLLDSNDESPLYLFDRRFAENMGIKVGSGPEEGAEYWRPECFGPDLFECLGAERPAHRWLIVGPRRSGSTFHKDPNATSAWNAVLQGSKYWIMFPPWVEVPGVYVSKDSSEVTSPLSIAEWLLVFHAEARALPECLEGICKEGEILHVPSGWWHLVINLEDGVAVTQNFVPRLHLGDVLRFLRDKTDQVTGFKGEVEDPYGLFVKRLEAGCPEVLQEALAEMEAKAQKKRKWELAIATDEETGGDSGGGFSFSFGGDDLDEEADD